MILKQLPRILAISTLMGMSVLAHADQALQELEGYVIDNAQAIVDAEENRQALQRDLRQLREEKQQLKATVDKLVTRLDQLTKALEQSTALTKAYANTKASQAEQAAKAHANTKASQAEHAAKSHANTKANQAQRTANDAITKANNWQSGNYCIFANGACPSGFSRHEGYLKAISLYSGSSSYIKQSTFGSSKIKCHGDCGQYGHWTGELYLQICCK